MMRMWLSLLVVMCFAPPVLGETLEEEVVGYVRIFNGDRGLHSNAADTFQHVGMSDTRIFDRIEKLLLEDADAARNNRDEKNRVARYIRALGFSGQEKYVPTIQKFVNDKVYERYAKAALEDMPSYKRWNPIISNRSTFDPKLSDDVNRVVNMLKSNDLLLKRIAAKRIYFAHQDPMLLKLLAEDLRIQYPMAVSDEYSVDTVAWMVKGLGNARSEAYRPLIQEVWRSAPNNKVRDYAKRALDQY